MKTNSHIIIAALLLLLLVGCEQETEKGFSRERLSPETLPPAQVWTINGPVENDKQEIEK